MSWALGGLEASMRVMKACLAPEMGSQMGAWKSMRRLNLRPCRQPWPVGRQHPVQHHPQGPHVRLEVVRLELDDLGSLVGGTPPSPAPSCRFLTAVASPKSASFTSGTPSTARVQEHVLGLDVAVDDSARDGSAPTASTSCRKMALAVFLGQAPRTGR